MNDYKNCMDLNKNMVEGQIKPLGNISKQVMDAFLSIPRDQFVPLELKNFHSWIREDQADKIIESLRRHIK